MIHTLPLQYTFIESKVPSNKIMIILHGRGDSSKGFTFLPNYLNIDEMNYLLLDAPYEYYGGFSWYDLPPSQFNGIKHSSMLLTETLNQLFLEDYIAEESFIFGFSQGSLLTFEFAARYAKVLAGYIAISGYIYNADKLLTEMNPQHKKSKNWLCTHGTRDNVLPYETSQSQIKLLQEGGFDIDFKSYPKAHNLEEDEIEMIASWIKERC